METNNNIINDLKNLISILNDGKIGYQTASQSVEKPALKAEFLKFAAERAAYAEELKAHLLRHGGVADNENGGILGFLHRAWIDIKHVLSSGEETAILSAIETGENAALDEFEKCMEDHVNHADHYQLLKRQRDGILNALKEIEVLHLALEK